MVIMFETNVSPSLAYNSLEQRTPQINMYEQCCIDQFVIQLGTKLTVHYWKNHMMSVDYDPQWLDHDKLLLIDSSILALSILMVWPYNFF